MSNKSLTFVSEQPKEILGMFRHLSMVILLILSFIGGTTNSGFQNVSLNWENYLLISNMIPLKTELILSNTWAMD